MDKAIGYQRVSTDKQKTLRQAESITAWCKANGAELVQILDEPEGVSGRSAVAKRAFRSGGPAGRAAIGHALQYYSLLASENFISIERAGFADLLRRVAAGGVDVVVMYALDRMSRDTLELLLLELILRRYGVRLVCLSEGSSIDTSTPEGRFFFRVMAAKCELEPDQTARRVSDTLRSGHQAWVDGKPGGFKVGRPPVGWRAVRDAAGEVIGYEHEPETWALVERARLLHAAGETYAVIAADLRISLSRVKPYLDSWDWDPAGGPAEAPAAEGQPGLGVEGGA